MAGRGRGRGRGRASSEVSESTTTPGGLVARNSDKEDSVVDSSPSDGKQNEVNDDTGNTSDTTAGGDNSRQAKLSLSDMKSIIEDPRTYSNQNDVKRVVVCAQHFVQTEEDVKTLASLIYNKCLEDTSLARRGSKICDALTCVEVGNVKFRNCLLAMVQADYKARAELWADEPTRFTGFLAFLCEVFSVMRTALNEVFKPLVNPIYDCFLLILGVVDDDGEQGGQTVNDDACELFAIQLQSVGKLLEENEEGRMLKLMDCIRTCIINSSSSPRVRCSLLEVVESYARGWEPAHSSTTQFYCDTAVGIISGLVL